MAGASSDGEVNHWPAFVDVLTTVIMVVTFLLVIMSAAVMQLSQRVIANYKQQMEAQELAKQGKWPGAGQAGAAARNAAQTSEVSPDSAPDGSSVAELGSVLRSDTAINGAERLTIRTRETKDTLAVQVKSVERADTAQGVEVKTADTLLKIAFAANAANIDDDNASRIIGFIRSKAAGGGKYEIWSFAPQTGSISEAERIAFYRAAMTRNLLVRAGIAPGAILTQIRVTDPSAGDGHMVRVVIKP
ncbi:hypothetical protein [Novosphingobium cyanobacteriorum]|uniref:Flagellar motor protein MotB n=1 Tax=Novosphingobium cyanobacteriorum TaxID=3024215 RepID=A0ABT6CNK9_9SPHN|nr:hypothetical protein [Novosphingobium cyanobacteriorum]MDF8335168.1 hypothetical protein [Novosphingobium cyanobacteriorum]